MPALFGAFIMWRSQGSHAALRARGHGGYLFVIDADEILHLEPTRLSGSMCKNWKAKEN